MVVVGVVGVIGLQLAPAPQARATVVATKPVVPAVTSVARELNDCRNRSGASFPEAYTDRDNLVIGPLAIIGGRYAGRTPANVTRDAGEAWKMPVLVRAGRRVTVTIPPEARREARLTYAFKDAPLLELPYTVTFRACRRGERSGSDADGKPVTFWSGFFYHRRAPLCVPLDVRVDGRTSRRVRLASGQGACM